MPSCPTCLAPQPDGADCCAKCGAHAVGSPVMLTVALTPEGVNGVARFDSRFPPAPLPAVPTVTPLPDRVPTPVAVPAGSPAAERAVTTPAPPASAATLVTTPPQPSVAVKLRVIRGLRLNAKYPVYPGRNVVGRFADRPVDIDLTGVEPDGQVWSSRRHAALTLDKGLLVVEDLNSLNGTWVNGTRLRAGTALSVKAGDVIQIGVAQLRVDVEPA